MAANLSFFILFALMATSALAQTPGAAPAASPRKSPVGSSSGAPHHPGVPMKAPSPTQSSVSSPFTTAPAPKLAPSSSPQAPPTSAPPSAPSADSDIPPPAFSGTHSTSAPSSPPVDNGAAVNNIAIGLSVAAVAVAVTLLL